MSLSRQTCEALPASQLVLTDCLLESRDTLPLVLQIEKFHGSSGGCARLLDRSSELAVSSGSNTTKRDKVAAQDGDTEKSFEWPFAGATGFGGYSPLCHNAFAAGSNLVRYRGVLNTPDLLPLHRPSVHSRMELGSNGGLVSSIPEFSPVPSWELADRHTTPRIRQPKRLTVPHGNPQLQVCRNYGGF